VGAHLDLNAKNARRSIAAIGSLGVENCTAIIRLGGNAITEAGLTVQERVKKPAEAAA
jgi:hypothetical protein